MAKRLFDLVVAVMGMIALTPVTACAVVGILLSSSGPVLYRAKRVGLGGRPFIMYKLRTMHSGSHAGSSWVTATPDPRVFPWGGVLRRLKIDELPQLVNVLKGDMSIIGPRPEDVEIADARYTEQDSLILSVRPGLASLGSLYEYTHGDRYLSGPDPDAGYTETLLPIKLALDKVYILHSSLLYDIRIVLRTVWTIMWIGAGRKHFADPPEMDEARRFLSDEILTRIAA